MFDDEYRNRIDKPSVTELLPPQNFFCTFEQLENARIEGTTNHELIKQWFETGETYGDKYLIEFSEFWKEHEKEFGKVLAVEQPLENDLFRGKPDIICEHAIIDFKRNIGNIKYHALQLAGYYILAKKNDLIKKCNVWLIIWHDGTRFKIRNVYNDNAEKTFLCLVKKYQCQSVIDNYFKI